MTAPPRTYVFCTRKSCISGSDFDEEDPPENFVLFGTAVFITNSFRRLRLASFSVHSNKVVFQWFLFLLLVFFAPNAFHSALQDGLFQGRNF